MIYLSFYFKLKTQWNNIKILFFIGSQHYLSLYVGIFISFGPVISVTFTLIYFYIAYCLYI